MGITAFPVLARLFETASQAKSCMSKTWEPNTHGQRGQRLRALWEHLELTQDASRVPPQSLQGLSVGCLYRDKTLSACKCSLSRTATAAR